MLIRSGLTAPKLRRQKGFPPRTPEPYEIRINLLPPRSSPRRLGGSSVLSLPTSPSLPSSLRPLFPLLLSSLFPLHHILSSSPHPPPSATPLHFPPPLPLLLSSLFPLHPHPPFAPQHPQHFSTSCPLSLRSYLVPFRSIASSSLPLPSTVRNTPPLPALSSPALI